jgi:hypothetical protein
MVQYDDEGASAANVANHGAQKESPAEAGLSRWS